MSAFQAVLFDECGCLKKKTIGRGMAALSPTDKSVRGALPTAPLGLETVFWVVLAMPQVEWQVTRRPFLCLEELLLQQWRASQGVPRFARALRTRNARPLAERPVSPTQLISTDSLRLRRWKTPLSRGAPASRLFPIFSSSSLRSFVLSSSPMSTISKAVYCARHSRISAVA